MLKLLLDRMFDFGLRLQEELMLVEQLLDSERQQSGFEWQPLEAGFAQLLVLLIVPLLVLLIAPLLALLMVPPPLVQHCFEARQGR